MKSIWQGGILRKALKLSLLVLLFMPTRAYSICCPDAYGNETLRCVIGGPNAPVPADACGYCPECPNSEYLNANPDANEPDWDGWNKICLCRTRAAGSASCATCSGCERVWQCRGNLIYYAQGTGTGGASRYCTASRGNSGAYCLNRCPVVEPAQIEVRPVAGPGLSECRSDENEVWEVEYSRCEDCRARGDCHAGVPITENLPWAFGSADNYYQDRGRQVGFVPTETRRRPRFECVGDQPHEMRQHEDAAGNCSWRLEPIEEPCDTRERCCTNCQPGQFKCKEVCRVGVPSPGGEGGRGRTSGSSGGRAGAYCATEVTATCPANGWVEGATNGEGCGNKGSCEHNFPSPSFPNTTTVYADCVVPGSINSLPWSEPGGASGVVTTGATGNVAYSCDIEGGGSNFCCVGANPPNYGLVCGILNPGPTPVGTIPGWPTPPTPPTPTAVISTPTPVVPVKPTLPPRVIVTPPGGGGCEDPEREIYLNPRTGQCCPPGEWPLGDGCCQYEGIQPDGTCCSAGKQCGGRCCAAGEVCVNPADGSCCPPTHRCGLSCCANPGECDTVTGRCCPVDRRCGKMCCGVEQRCERRGSTGRCVDKRATPAPEGPTPTPIPTATPTVVVGEPAKAREVFIVD